MGGGGRLETDVLSSTIFKVCATVMDIAYMCTCTSNAYCGFQIKKMHNLADEWVYYEDTVGTETEKQQS